MTNVKITGEELRWAFEQYENQELRRVDYSSDGLMVAVMGEYTHEDPKLSAGCEVGIKLGLLIASRRHSVELAHDLGA
jgi:hypothetical protein